MSEYIGKERLLWIEFHMLIVLVSFLSKLNLKMLPMYF